MKILGKLLLFIIVLAVIGGAWMVFGGKSATGNRATSSVVLKKEKDIYGKLMAYEPRYYSDDYGSVRVFGSVKNTSDKTCNYVKFEIEVRDKDSKILRTLNVTVNNIAPNSIKSYDTNGGMFADGIILKSKAVEAGFAKR